MHHCRLQVHQWLKQQPSFGFEAVRGLGGGWHAGRARAARTLAHAPQPLDRTRLVVAAPGRSRPAKPGPLAGCRWVAVQATRGNSGLLDSDTVTTPGKR